MNTHTTGKTMTQPTPLLSVRDLRVEVGERTVLESISLDIQSGELVVLMGANGSGKSTLGLTLAGLLLYPVTNTLGMGQLGVLLTLACVVDVRDEAQIAAADLLVLTKTDLVDSSTADAAQSRLRSLAPASPVIDGSLVRREPGALGRFLAIGGHRNRDAAGVPGPSLFDLHQTHTVPLRDPLTRADIEALVSDLRTSFDGRTVARAKGIVELVDGNGPRLALVQLVGPRYEITPLLPNEHQRPTDLVVITVSPTDPA
mgnify:CR=1 FL=1